MSGSRRAGLLVLLAVAPACGERLVQFGSGGGDGDADAGDSDDGDDDGAGPADAGPSGPDASDLDAAVSSLTVVSTDPTPDGVTGVSINKVVEATFSRAMDPDTITDATFLVQQDKTDVVGDVDYDPLTRTATFTPVDPLTVGLEYTATITTGAMTPDGAALGMEHSWSFETDACGLPSVELESASTHAILAYSAVSSTGAVGTVVTGDIGLFPATETAFTGFPPGIHNGTLNAGNMAGEVALADMTTAYDQAELLSLCAITVTPTDLGGTTRTPGLYRSGSSLDITSGDLTLDAQGDDDAVFVFQMPSSTLTVANGRSVILSGGARAENVYWQVGSSATLGTTVEFHGTILADLSITVNTGTSVVGRLLARTGAVSLDTNVVTSPP
jgi:hypothetical protein